MLVASSRSAGGSIRPAGVFMPLRARCGPTTLSPVARKRAARIKPAENWAQDEGDYLNYRSAALGVAARVFSLYGALKVVERRLLSVLAQKCQKKSIKDASQYSSRLPETSLHPRMRFGLHLPCTHIGRSASDCLVSAQRPLAASAASATHPHPTCSFCTLLKLGAAVRRRFDAPTPSAVGP